MADILLKKQAAGPDAVFTKTADAGVFRDSEECGPAVQELENGSGTGDQLDEYTTDPYAAPARVYNITSGTAWFWQSGGQMKNDFSATTDSYYLHSDHGDVKNLEIEVKMYIRSNYRAGYCGPVIYKDASNYCWFGFCGRDVFRACRIYTLIDGVAFNATFPLDVDYCATWTRFKVKVNGNRFYVKIWTDGDTEPSDWLFEFVRDDKLAPVAGEVGMRFVGSLGHSKDYVYVDELTVNSGMDYPSDSPVKYMRFNSGVAGHTWPEELVKLFTNLNYYDSGTCKAKFAYTDSDWGQTEVDDGTIDAALSGTWLEPDESNEVTAPGGSGQYCWIAIQFNSDSQKQTSCLMAVDTKRELSI